MSFQRSRMPSVLQDLCPSIWQLLSSRAKLNPPSGLTSFVSGADARMGRMLLRSADRRIQNLIAKTSLKTVGDAYRRDLSGVQTIGALAEILCEMTLVDSVGSMSSICPTLRPQSGLGTACDFRIVVDGNAIYGEVKRFADDFPSWTHERRRSIQKSPPHIQKPQAKRPRSMDLYSKLTDVHKQFPVGTLNVLFVFHPSLGSTPTYMQQALLGDASLSGESLGGPLCDDSLFSLSEW